MIMAKYMKNKYLWNNINKLMVDKVELYLDVLSEYLRMTGKLFNTFLMFLVG